MKVIAKISKSQGLVKSVGLYFVYYETSGFSHRRYFDTLKEAIDYCKSENMEYVTVNGLKETEC